MIIVKQAYQSSHLLIYLRQKNVVNFNGIYSVCFFNISLLFLIYKYVLFFGRCLVDLYLNLAVWSACARTDVDRGLIWDHVVAHNCALTSHTTLTHKLIDTHATKKEREKSENKKCRISSDTRHKHGINGDNQIEFLNVLWCHCGGKFTSPYLRLSFCPFTIIN